MPDSDTEYINWICLHAFVHIYFPTCRIYFHESTILSIISEICQHVNLLGNLLRILLFKMSKRKDLPGWSSVLVCSWVEQVDSLAKQRQSWARTGTLWEGGACLQQWIPEGLQCNQRMLLQTMRPFSICRS